MLLMPCEIDQLSEHSFVHLKLSSLRWNLCCDTRQLVTTIDKLLRHETATRRNSKHEKSRNLYVVANVVVTESPGPFIGGAEMLYNLTGGSVVS